MAERVLLTGAGGFVSRVLSERLVCEGHAVRAIRDGLSARSGPCRCGRPAGRSDARRGQAPRLSRVGHVAHCSGTAVATAEIPHETNLAVNANLAGAPALPRKRYPTASDRSRRSGGISGSVADRSIENETLSAPQGRPRPLGTRERAFSRGRFRQNGLAAIRRPCWPRAGREWDLVPWPGWRRDRLTCRSPVLSEVHAPRRRNSATRLCRRRD